MLVVDDSRMMTDIMTVILRSLGIGSVRSVTSGSAALNCLSSQSFDLVFVDLVMEPMDGVTLIRRIRTDEDSPDPFIPIVVVSGYTDPARVLAARDAGANEFMAKPFSVQGVARRLEEVIRRPRPFIRSSVYFGPDRRRKIEEFTGEERRVTARAPRAALTQGEIEAMLAR
jgi:two-component system chemotaxis response regulator CheY